MNVGIIGYGVMGKIHFRILKQLSLERHIRIAIHDIADIGIPPIECDLLSYDHLLKWSDVVIISCSTEYHTKIAIDVLSLGKPVFIEKPVALCVEDIYKIQKAAGSIPVFAGYIERYNPAILDLFKILSEIDSTDIKYFSTQRINNVPQTIRKSSGIVVDLGVHDFDLVYQLFGEMIINHSFVERHEKLDILASICVTTERGISGNIYLSWIDISKRRVITVYTTTSVITVDLVDQRIDVMDRINGRIWTKVDKTEPARIEMEAFLNLLEGKGCWDNDPLGIKSVEYTNLCKEGKHI